MVSFGTGGFLALVSANVVAPVTRLEDKFASFWIISLVVKNVTGATASAGTSAILFSIIQMHIIRYISQLLYSVKLYIIQIVLKIGIYVQYNIII